MIRFEDVWFSYEKDDPVFRSLDYELRPGLTLLLGPNGCGKSTFLKLAAGVEKPDRGRVIIDGYDLWTEEVRARKSLAYLPEFPDVTPYATLREVLNLVCRLRGEPLACGQEVLQFFGLVDVADHTIRQLSSGQRKRALFAATFVGRPDHFLLDEPLDALDRGVADQALAWIGDKVRAGAVVGIVSHSIEPFVSIATEALTFKEGRLFARRDLPADLGARVSLLEDLARGRYSGNPHAGSPGTKEQASPG